MIYEISEKLREKIKVDMVINETANWKFTDDHIGSLEFKEDEDDIFNECIEWAKNIHCDFPTSKNYLKVDKIGRFKGVRPWPRGYNPHIKTIAFQVSEYEKESWQDWFIPTEDEDYSLTGPPK